MKVIVVKMQGSIDIVCPKSSFTEDSSGILRLVKAWGMNHVSFQNYNAYRVDADFNPVWSHGGEKGDGNDLKLLRHVSIKDYMYYYEDEMQSLK